VVPDARWGIRLLELNQMETLGLESQWRRLSHILSRVLGAELVQRRRDATRQIGENEDIITHCYVLQHIH
jgi:hypothetical protein